MHLSFFSSPNSPYYIFAPDYRQSSAGIRCLHYLCHALNELGEEAYIAPATVFHGPLRTPPLTPETIRRHFLTGRTPIAVYPEVARGNPLPGPVVARWLLNKPGHLGGDSEYAADELIYYIQKWCLPPGMKGEMLTLPTVDFSIFNNDDNPDDKSRKGACYYANKYLTFGGRIDEDIERNATSLCLNVPRSPHELANILRRSQVMYCYEQSSIILEALACGCPVLIVPSAYWNEHGSEQTPRGAIRMADEPDALAKATQDIVTYQASSAENLKSSWRQVRRFIEQTQLAALRFRDDASRSSLHEQVSGNLQMARNIWAVPASQRDKFKSLLDQVYPLTDRASAATAGTDEKRQPSGRIEPALTPAELSLFEARVPAWEAHPIFHLIVIDDDVADDALARTLQSLARQTYTRVITTVISARHPAPENPGKGSLEWRQTKGDPRILVNQAITQSSADWCGIMRAGDSLAPHAFLVFGEFLNVHRTCAALYTDEAITDPARGIEVPDLRPDLDVDRLRSNGYIRGLLLAKRELWLTIGGWLALPDGLDELDAALRLAEACGKDGFGHVPGILFRRDVSAYATNVNAASQQMRRHIVQEHLGRQNIAATVEDGLLPGHVRVRYALERPPLVSIVIPTRNRAAALEACLNSLVEATEYPEFEVLVVDHGNDDPTARAYLDGLAQLGNDRIRVLRYEGSFNLAKLFNFAAAEATGELLLLLHDDVTAAHPDWLLNMAALCTRPEVGAVGARLLLPDSTLQQAWIVPIKAGITVPPFHHWPLDAPDSRMHLNTEQEVSAVGSACMLVKKAAFFEVGGMDAERFPEHFADVDFCIKLGAAGYKIVWTPYATLVHDSDNSTWGDRAANDALIVKWGKTVAQDPRFNPCLSIGSDSCQIETDPIFLPDVITWHPLPNVYAMPSDLDGAGHYRIIQPTRSATESCLARGRVSRGYPILAVMERFEIDIVFSQRQMEDRQLEELSRYRKLLNCRIVIDIDDLITQVSDKNIHKKFLFKDMKARLRQLGGVAHRFTVSTEPLAHEFRQYHEDIRVVPNALMRSQWAHLTSARGTSRKMRVGWAGGISHQGDLEIVRDVVRDLADEVEWVFMGMQLDELIPHIKEFHKGVAFPAYAEKLASLNLDLAIAPLEINRFNECKSHLRLLEYGILGIPVIATDIHPYRSGFPVTRVKNKHNDWVRAIRDHINDAEENYRRGDALKQYILDRWMLDQHVAEWAAAWN